MCRNERPRVNSQAARKSSYDCKSKGALRTVAGNNKAKPLTGLFQWIETLKGEVNQLHSEAKNDN